MFLVNWLLHGVKGYPDGNFGADSSRGLNAEAAAQLTGTLFHDGDSEVSSQRQRSIGLKEAVAIVANGEAKRIAVVPQVNDDARALGVTDRVRDSFLADADEMMHATGREADLLAFHIERCIDGSLEMVRG
jgi:hypothetical protein